MSTTIFNARIGFDPKVKTASAGGEYVLLNVSKRSGKDQNGQPVYSEFHLAVWGERDVALARRLGVGDYITFTIERERVETWTGQDGKCHPFMSGNVRTGELCAVYTNKPSAGLFQYEQEAENQRAAHKAQQKVVAPAPTPAPAPATNGLIQPVQQQYTASVPTPAPASAPSTQYSSPVMNGIEVPF